jgi:hypothetical protein
MAAPQNLAQFNVEATSAGFQLHIESEGGDVLDLVATEEQLDVIVDALEEVLTEDVNEPDLERDA